MYSIPILSVNFLQIQQRFNNDDLARIAVNAEWPGKMILNVALA